MTSVVWGQLSFCNLLEGCTSPASLEQMILSSNASVDILELSDASYTIGRSPGCTFNVNSPFVSSNHCKILVSNENDIFEIFVQDLQSSNGTFVNGEEIQKGARRRLYSGDVIVLSLLSKTARFPTFKIEIHDLDNTKKTSRKRRKTVSRDPQLVVSELEVEIGQLKSKILILEAASKQKDEAELRIAKQQVDISNLECKAKALEVELNAMKMIQQKYEDALKDNENLIGVIEEQEIELDSIKRQTEEYRRELNKNDIVFSKESKIVQEALQRMARVLQKSEACKQMTTNIGDHKPSQTQYSVSHGADYDKDVPDMSQDPVPSKSVTTASGSFEHTYKAPASTKAVIPETESDAQQSKSIAGQVSKPSTCSTRSKSGINIQSQGC